MSEEEEPKAKEEFVRVQKAPVPLTPDLYARLIEEELPVSKEPLKEELWGVLSRLLTQSFISEEDYKKMRAKIRYILLIKLMSKPPREITFEDLIDFEQIDLISALQLRRSINGNEKAVLLNQWRVHEKPKKRGFLASLFGV